MATETRTVEQIEAEIIQLGDEITVLREKRVALRQEADVHWKARQQEIIDNPSEIPPQRVGEGEDPESAG
jgi:hypothetical protein